MSAILFREATAHDAQPFLDYLAMIGGENHHLAFGPGVSLEQEQAVLKACRESETDDILTAWAADRLMRGRRYNRQTRPRTRHVGILAISVVKAWWGCGVAKRMMDALMTHTRENGAGKMNRGVHADKVKAIQWYKRLGFASEGRRSRAFKVGDELFDEVCMGMEL